MGLLTIEAERRVLTWALSNPFDTSVTFAQPIMVRLMETSGDATTAGDEVTGSSYAPVDATFAQTTSVDGVEFINTVSVDFSSLDPDNSVSVEGAELWDSSATPVRIAFADFSSTQVIPAGGALSIGIGQLKVRLG